MPIDKLLRMLAAEEAKVEAMERDMIDVTPGVDDVEAAAESDPPAAAG